MRFKKLIDTDIEVIDKWCLELLHCPDCFKSKTIKMKQKLTMLSFLGLHSRLGVFYCISCKQIVEPLDKSELRDFKLKYIIDGDTKINKR